MGSPTVYRLPRKSIPAKKPSDTAISKWKKHRASRGKDETPPKLKN